MAAAYLLHWLSWLQNEFKSKPNSLNSNTQTSFPSQLQIPLLIHGIDPQEPGSRWQTPRSELVAIGKLMVIGFCQTAAVRLANWWWLCTGCTFEIAQLLPCTVRIQSHNNPSFLIIQGSKTFINLHTWLTKLNGSSSFFSPWFLQLKWTQILILVKPSKPILVFSVHGYKSTAAAAGI